MATTATTTKVVAATTTTELLMSEVADVVPSLSHLNSDKTFTTTASADFRALGESMLGVI